MVLFEFDKIMKEKYSNYKTNEPDKNKQIDYEQFYNLGIEKMTDIFPFYFTKINPHYIYPIVLNRKNKILFSCIDEKFSLKNVTSILVYRKTKSHEQVKYYIPILGTHERFRKFGYGKVIIDEFVQWIKQTDKSEIPKKILLKSLEASMGFYQSYGFVSTELKSNRLFYKYETGDELKTNPEKILEYIIQ